MFRAKRGVLVVSLCMSVAQCQWLAAMTDEKVLGLVS